MLAYRILTGEITNVRGIFHDRFHLSSPINNAAQTHFITKVFNSKGATVKKVLPVK